MVNNPMEDNKDELYLGRVFARLLTLSNDLALLTISNLTITLSIWSALANHLAIGTAPFGIDSLSIEECPFPLHYGLLTKLSSHILEAQGERPGDLFGFYFVDVDKGGDRTWVKQLGDYIVIVERQVVFGRPSSAAGMIIRLPDGTFFCAGYGYQATLKYERPKVTCTGIMTVEEKDFDDKGDLFTTQLLNGDETAHHAAIILSAENPIWAYFLPRFSHQRRR
ncbi:hypothetical protein ACHAQH_008225 [Verticillium albo-atrum]